ncbi:MAG: hypothetical protein A2X87_04035 [Deltaproteobacteria bacterium GWC2_42_51]|nr:MAG: hypothetical protein A2067_09410 [Deltaproteobacteria bacterium GWB2_42_7]OGP33421.1 MAG: hypothetical protein A2X87_04035 [Deltaproteobacteria bacterium GWC2_42_51]OGP43317.1 MAG: hypothetical protein A2090_05455 [Deltaproteobacteria bacterium GWD2_42_10]OGP47234.1 MAG: hypothetical protein A2022_05795 [Deltaproteobacteria bacterium GWF2_42_12]OGQ38483.1 MAG: hypothetical protein A3H47_08540 [Deltaproteobacteria bacterium RIFCSPLOWO2_02_FULL_42_39]OGQ65734.1 MAG: hypothetical protein 
MEDLSSLQLSEEDIKSLKETFYHQAVELVELLTQDVLLLEGSKDKGERLKTIKRIFHTLKGDSASIGLKGLSSLTHKAEDLLHAIESGLVEIDSDLTDILLNIADCVHEAIDKSLAGADTPHIPIMMKNIDSFLNERSGEHDKSDTNASSIFGEYQRLLLADYRKQGREVYNIRLSFSEDCHMKSAGVVLILQHLTGIGDIIRTSPPQDAKEIEYADAIEVVIASTMARNEIQKFCSIPGVVGNVTVEEFKEQDIAIIPKDLSPTQDSFVTQKTISPAATIRVESEKMDKIMDLVGELVIGRSMIAQLLLEFEERFPREEMLGRFASASSFVERSLSDLQRSVMNLRMMPIDKVFKRFPRVVRDLAKAGDKDIRLIIHGEDTEVDKGLVDVIGEPLIHIVRNAIDHGIETVEERNALGKDIQGTIFLEAYHQGNDIVIEVKDDGRGIDTKLIKEKAIEKGLISNDELEKISDDDAIDFIFLPGFSTAKVLSEVSGRGIGMDVVKTVVEGLRGGIKVKSELGVGTTFILRFPLTLAIIKAILFNVSNRLFAIPLVSVKEITRVFVKDISLVNNKEVLRLREKVIPLIRLERIVNIDRRGTRRDKLYVIVVNIEDRDIGIIVDRLVGEEELVIKSVVSHRLVNTSMIGGASILGNGQVVLILNPSAIVKKAGVRAIGNEQASVSA